MGGCGEALCGGLLLRLQGCRNSTVMTADSSSHLGEPSSSETTIEAASLLPAAAGLSWCVGPGGCRGGGGRGLILRLVTAGAVETPFLCAVGPYDDSRARASAAPRQAKRRQGEWATAELVRHSKRVSLNARRRSRCASRMQEQPANPAYALKIEGKKTPACLRLDGVSILRHCQSALPGPLLQRPMASGRTSGMPLSP
jgi:hypothetical protein